MRITAFVATVALTIGLPALAQEAQTFGKGVKNEDSVKVAELLAHADQYVGKTVRVEGVVTDVCAKAGCWMEILGDGSSSTIRIKVEDGVMVFPTSAKGKQVVAEGVFTKIEMTADEARAEAKHMAADRGEKLDAKKAAQVAPSVTYEIRGTGAIIK
jgi:hypothetical protein